MITASQILAHLWGDYIFQSDWMAQNKTKSSIAAAIHAIAYSLVFLLFRPSLAAFAVIVGTHFLIDRFRLARFVVWAKNWIAPWRRLYYAEDHTRLNIQQAFYKWEPPIGRLKDCPTGYPPDVPPWMSVWLLIVADNILHITINAAALRYL